MLNVWISRDVVGALDRHRDETGDYVFAYRPTFQPGQDVSLTMPWSLKSYSYKNGLHPVFQMNLPEGRLKESIERMFRKRVQGFDQLALLEIIGCSQIGRLRFSNDPNLIDQVPLQSVQELIAYEGTEDLLRDLLERFSGVSGVSGVQPKVLIKDQDLAKQSGHSDNKARITVKGATHIVKGWDANEFAHLAANEFFCMSVARRAGLQTPNVFLSDNNRFLVVERFDLTETGNYLGFEDFCSLNGVSTDEKYNGSYEQLAKRIRDYVSPAHQYEALESFFRSLTVSCAVRNGDAHLKNFGVLYEAADKPVKLAPAYDIVTTPPYIKGDSLALTLEGSKRFPTAKKLLNFAKLQCNLQPARSRAILEEVAESVVKTMSDLRLHCKAHPDFSVVGEAMLREWNEGVNVACNTHV
ncbi:MAG: type II toxin-antitoxin system HipA family toxin [Rhodocyclaceae bacterium]|nr:type II toxin-antitoxin system HipA family toxin [Rhodocyclaceae bacterium]